MKQYTFLIIVLSIITHSCISKIDSENDQYQIYSLILNKRSGLDKINWYEDEKVPAKYLKGDSLNIYIRYRDSIKKQMNKKNFYVLINDTTVSSTVEMNELKYSVINNAFFLKQHFSGDTSFKKIILEWKPFQDKGNIINKSKLKPVFQYHLSITVSTNEQDYLLASLKFSDVTFNGNHTKAIVYVVDRGGSFYFLEKANNQWVIKNKILMWTLD